MWNLDEYCKLIVNSVRLRPLFWNFLITGAMFWFHHWTPRARWTGNSSFLMSMSLMSFARSFSGILRRGENRSTRRKTSRSKGENQKQTQPTYGVDAGIWTRATLVGGERSHHCAIPCWGGIRSSSLWVLWNFSCLRRRYSTISVGDVVLWEWLGIYDESSEACFQVRLQTGVCKMRFQ